MRGFVLAYFCLVVGFSQTIAQSEYRIGSLPHITFSIPLTPSWKLNTKIETRQIALSTDIPDLHLEYERTDIATVFTKKLGTNSFGIGYLMRVQDKTLTHRFIQQFFFGSGHGVVRFAHRVTADQTFRETEKTEFRFRYRIGAEIPTNGESIDPGERYVKFTHEHLLSIQGKVTDLEIRTLATIGFFFSDKFKIETGLEYRTSGFFNNATEHAIWLNLGGFVSF